MDHALNDALDKYERGHLTRRQLLLKLSGLIGLAAAGSSGSAAGTAMSTSSTFEATELNHIALRVTDVSRSRDFYVKHLGLEIASDSRSSAFLNCGKNFVALFRGRDPRMDHYCFSVKNYNVGDAEEKLRAENLKDIRRTANRIYFSDPDGITVQLAAESHMP